MTEEKSTVSIESSVRSWDTATIARKAISEWQIQLRALLPSHEDSAVNFVWSDYVKPFSRLERLVGDTELLDDSKREELEKYRSENSIIDVHGPAGEFLKFAEGRSEYHAFGAFAWLSRKYNVAQNHAAKNATTKIHRQDSSEKHHFESGVVSAKLFEMWGIDSFDASAAINRTRNRVVNSAQEIDKLVEVLKQKIVVGAPESFWAGRATYYRNASLISGICLALLVWFSVNFAVDQVGDFRDPINQNTFVLIKSSVAMVIIFWLLLLIGRIFLGQLQLYSDAKERVVMVQTFLSLVHDRSVDALKDRDLVLRSLFKSGATGVFRDQGDTSAVVNLLNQVSGKSNS